ncbi:MAG: RNA polymerase sigma factor [Dysgonamonadaceae bacterium]|nr:RNA polymerase sigma factor [Dysgonamonadaceae bacterium]MDD4728967.1 RNA polymerase sigma factor [Dysgonamonadaceae bacterium]
MTSNEKDKDFELIQNIRKGNSSAMKELYLHYIQYLTAVCSRYIIIEADLKDVLQESFVKIFTSIDKFEYRGVGSLKAWMARIVVNESLKFIKKNERFDFVQNEWELPDVTNEEAPDTDDIPAHVIQEMIRQLPIGYRTVFNLYVFEDKSHKEIASILGIKENTSASQLYKAKNKLAEKINEYKMTL